MILLFVVGCAAMGPDPRLKYVQVPADFALRFEVHGDPEARDAFGRSSQYTLLPNRLLTISAGLSPSGKPKPPVVTTVTPDQYDALARYVLEQRLMMQPSYPRAQGHDANAVSYEVECVANGRTHTYETTPAESPATARLLGMLVSLAPKRSNYE